TLQWMGITPAGRMTPRTGVAAVLEPVLVRSQDARTTASTVPDDRLATVRGEADAPFAGGVPDSLFDHSADVEFILDPVTLRKGRAHTVLRLNPNVQGEKAVITF
ncbi:MAG: hypothetical protein AAB113_01165, partial [Candidatus Eisenbacteria bacterium]